MESGAWSHSLLQFLEDCFEPGFIVMSSSRKRKVISKKATAARLSKPSALKTGSRRIDVVLPAANAIDGPPTFNEDGKRPRGSPSVFTISTAPPKKLKKSKVMYLFFSSSSFLFLLLLLQFFFLLPFSSPSHLFFLSFFLAYCSTPEKEYGRSYYRSPALLLDAVQPQLQSLEARWNAIVQYYKLRVEEPDVGIEEAKRRVGGTIDVGPKTISNLLKRVEEEKSLQRRRYIRYSFVLLNTSFLFREESDRRDADVDAALTKVFRDYGGGISHFSFHVRVLSFSINYTGVHVLRQRFARRTCL